MLSGMLLQFAPPLLLKALLEQLEDQDSDTVRGYWIAGLMLAVPAAICLFGAQTQVQHAAVEYM